MIRMAAMVLGLTAWAGTAPAGETAVSATAAQSAVSAVPAASEATADFSLLTQPMKMQTLVAYVGNQLKLKFIYDPADLEAAGTVAVEANQPVKVSELYGLLENVLRGKNLVMIRAKDGDWVRVLPESKAAGFTQLPVPKMKAPEVKATNTTASSSCAAASGISPSPGTGVSPSSK